MRKELIEELNKRGTAEISNGVVNQVTQAIGEKDDSVEMLVFGEMRKERIMPIEQACAKCDFWKGKFDTTKSCQTA